MSQTTHLVLTLDTEGTQTAEPLHFSSYGVAHRYAIEHCPGEPGSLGLVLVVVGRDRPGIVLVAYQSLRSLGRCKGVMVDGCCAEPIESLPRLAREGLDWFRSYYAGLEWAHGSVSSPIP